MTKNGSDVHPPVMLTAYTEDTSSLQKHERSSGKGSRGFSPGGVQGASPWPSLFPKECIENAL
jgi:hypothetical protein